MKEPPRHLAEPTVDIPILDWWAGCYDHVFVVLNPFFRVPGYTPATAAYGPIRSDVTTATDIVELVTRPHQPRPNEAPEDFDDIIKETGQIVGWAEVQKAIGVQDFQTFARNVWLWTVQVTRNDTDPAIYKALDQYQMQTGTYPPEDDTLAAVLEPTLEQYLTALGFEQVEYWDEWRQVVETKPVSLLRKGAPCVSVKGEMLCAVAAPGMVLSWSHDDLFGLLALTDDMMHRANPAAYFEGFWVDRHTYCDVFNPPAMFEREPPKPRN